VAKDAHGRTLWSEVRHMHSHSFKFQIHAGKHRQLDGYAARLGHKAEEYLGLGAHQRTVLVYGASKLASSVPGKLPAATWRRPRR
jgi:hypothetical protein